MNYHHAFFRELKQSKNKKRFGYEVKHHFNYVGCRAVSDTNKKM